MKITSRFVLKAPIKDIPYSNEEVGLEIESDEIEQGDWTAVKALMLTQMKEIVNDYINKLSDEVLKGQSSVVEKIQVELAKQYEDKLAKASKEVYRLRDLCDKHNINYHDINYKEKENEGV